MAVHVPIRYILMLSSSQILTNSHLLLRPHRIEDAEAIARAVRESLPELCRYMPWCFSPPSAKGYMESVTLGHSCVFCFGLEAIRTLSA